MSDEVTIENEWDFYPCRVDGEPASILINLRFRYEDPAEHNDHVYHAFIRMREAGPQGLGTRGEMDRLTPLEDAVFDRVEQAGAQPVGRLRYQGVWQLSAYGPKELPWAAWIAELVGADVEVQCHADPDSNYLNDFLLPDDERLQWIMDRRVCDQLREHGDDASLPRPVEHFLEYENTAPEGLVEAIRELGFDVTDSGDGLECVKVHSVELETVHEVSMQLSELADRYEAAYSGWGAPVTKPGAALN
jgi:regulator of RNase E activity RraB